MRHGDREVLGGDAQVTAAFGVGGREHLQHPAAQQVIGQVQIIGDNRHPLAVVTLHDQRAGCDHAGEDVRAELGCGMLVRVVTTAAGNAGSRGRELPCRGPQVPAGFDDRGTGAGLRVTRAAVATYALAGAGRTFIRAQIQIILHAIAVAVLLLRRAAVGIGGRAICGHRALVFGIVDAVGITVALRRRAAVAVHAFTGWRRHRTQVAPVGHAVTVAVLLRRPCRQFRTACRVRHSLRVAGVDDVALAVQEVRLLALGEGG